MTDTREMMTRRVNPARLISLSLSTTAVVLLFLASGALFLLGTVLEQTADLPSGVTQLESDATVNWQVVAAFVVPWLLALAGVGLAWLTLNRRSDVLVHGSAVAAALVGAAAFVLTY